jgi:hypothetical protein
MFAVVVLSSPPFGDLAALTTQDLFERDNANG